jgi:hypothetical protein
MATTQTRETTSIKKGTVNEKFLPGLASAVEVGFVAGGTSCANQIDRQVEIVMVRGEGIRRLRRCVLSIRGSKNNECGHL